MVLARLGRGEDSDTSVSLQDSESKDQTPVVPEGTVGLEEVSPSDPRYYQAVPVPP